jgi:hypothetical protein
MTEPIEHSYVLHRWGAAAAARRPVVAAFSQAHRMADRAWRVTNVLAGRLRR